MAGLIKPLFFETALHIYRLFKEREYRAYHFLESRFGAKARYVDGKTKIHGWDVFFPDSQSFLSNYKEIFLEKIYAFKSDNPAPVILDLGANIGLSVLFFKSLYPEAKITAFEADPKIFTYLKKNIEGNALVDVELINRAAWNEETRLKFSPDGADGGSVASAEADSSLEVEAIDIADFFKGRKIDFLKMDIEGAETTVLPACREYLREVKFLFVEYHSRAGQRQDLDKIIHIITQAGFRIHCHNVFKSPSPFLELMEKSGFDLQLNIFGCRD